MTSMLGTVIAFALVFTTVLSAAQELGGETSAWNRFGTSLATIDDLDADGLRELVIGDPGYGTGAAGPFGQIVVVSPVHGTVFWRVTGDDPALRIGSSVATPGDLDGDARADVVTSVFGAEHTLVSAIGSTGKPLYTALLPPAKSGYPAAPSMCSIDDLDGDGVGDLVVGIPDDDEAGERSGSVWWISGANGETLRRRLGPGAGARYGWQVRSAGDLDGDGQEDLLVCAPGDAESGGAVHVVSGSGETLRVHTDPWSGSWHLLSAASVGDLDGDGRHDVAVAWGDCSVMAYSGRSGDAIRSWSMHRRGGKAFVRGSALIGLGDIDGDGLAELAVGLPQSIVRDGPCAWVLRGRGDEALLDILSNLEQDDIERLDRCFGADNSIWDDQPGVSLAAVGDVDGDGLPDLAVGSASDRCFECTGAVGIWSPARGERLRLLTACDVRE